MRARVSQYPRTCFEGCSGCRDVVREDDRLAPERRYRPEHPTSFRHLERALDIESPTGGHQGGLWWRGPHPTQSARNRRAEVRR